MALPGSRTPADLRDRAELYRHATEPVDLARFVLERLPSAPERGRRLLDAGGGPGAYLAALAQVRPDWWGVAAGSSAPLLAPAARRHPTALSDAGALPFAAGAFDAVIVGRLVPPAADPAGIGPVAAELARVCAPGGRVLVVLDAHRHLAELRALVDEAAGGPLLAGAVRLALEDGPAALAPYLVVERIDVVSDQIVVRTAGPVLTYVRGLRAQIEPRLRGFTGVTMVLARVRASLEATLARDGQWSTAVETGVLVCRPA